MLIGCKFRIYPTEQQEKILFEYCKEAHKLWNFVVARYKDKDLPKTGIHGIKDFSVIQLRQEYTENKIPLPDRIYMGILETYKNVVNRVYKKIGNKPKFHKYNSNKRSFYICGRNYKVSKDFTIPLPHANGFSVKGFSKIKIDKKYCQKFNIKEIKEPRYTYKNRKWFLSGAYEVEEPTKQNNIETIGLDWGIKNFMTSSKGEFINYPRSVIREFYRINKLKSIRDKKVKNSNNWHKVNSKIIKAYERFENLKKDFIEQTTTRLCRYNNVAIEDLINAKIKMSNKNRRRLMQINPLSRFTDKLEWKCKKFGTEFYKVNPTYTSQICSKCGQLMNLTLKDRICNCSCGNVMDRDINAAINIVAKTVCGSL